MSDIKAYGILIFTQSSPGDSNNNSQDSDGSQNVLHCQNILIIHCQCDKHSQHRAREEGNVLGQHSQQWGSEGVHVFGCGLVATT